MILNTVYDINKAAESNKGDPAAEDLCSGPTTMVTTKALSQLKAHVCFDASGSL